MPLLETKDNSFSWIDERFGVPYHSRRGAWTESHHVYLTRGWETAWTAYQAELDPQDPAPFFALELGYGTGLNAALVAHWMEENAPESQYVYLALEKYPLRPDEESAYWDALVSVRPAALLLSGAIFGLVHMNLGYFLPLAGLGVALALLYEWSGSLWVPVIAHAAWNAITIASVHLTFHGAA